MEYSSPDDYSKHFGVGCIDVGLGSKSISLLKGRGGGGGGGGSSLSKG